jgi:hypothetical protein
MVHTCIRRSGIPEWDCLNLALHADQARSASRVEQLEYLCSFIVATSCGQQQVGQREVILGDEAPPVFPVAIKDPTPDEEGSSFVSLGERLGPCNPFNGDRRCADRVALTLEMIQQSHDAFDFVGFIEPFVVVTDRSVDGKDDREIRQPQLACK